MSKGIATRNCKVSCAGYNGRMILQCVMAMADVGLGSLVMVYVIVVANQS